MKRIIGIGLILTVLFSLMTGCGKTGSEKGGEEGERTKETVEKGEKVRFALLSGTTGLGAAELIVRSEKGESENQYDIEVFSDPSAIIAGIRTGKYDLAALPVNAAAKLCNMPDTDVCAVAVNTLGVLYVLENGSETVKTVGDLKGKTVYATGQGATPQYILEYILQKNGLTAGKDVTVIYRATADELQIDISEQGRIAVVPEPKATVITKAIPNVRYALDLTKEWDKTADCTLCQGCVIATAQFAKSHKEALEKFLAEYRESINFVNKADDAAANAVVAAKIIGKAPIAKAAIPKCNLVCLTGEEMKEALSGTLGVLYSLDRTSVGGKMPEDAFYYSE